jgi:hypothetical protein
MKQHFRVVWNYDISVSVIGNGIEQSYKQYKAYHALNNEPCYRNHAVHFANWFLVRGFQVYIYPHEGGCIDMLTLKFFLGLGKKIGEVLQGVVLGRPKTEPEVTLYV